MEKGVATVEGTFLGFLFVGLSLQHLFFKGPSGKKNIVPSDDSIDAMRCAGCGLVILEGTTHTQQRMNERARKLGRLFAKKKKRG